MRLHLVIIAIVVVVIGEAVEFRHERALKRQVNALQAEVNELKFRVTNAEMKEDAVGR